MARLRSQRYVSKPSERRVSCTKETWDESMLCKFTPLELMSQQASLMRSLSASSTFFRMEPWTRRASNMVAVSQRRGYRLRERGRCSGFRLHGMRASGRTQQREPATEEVHSKLAAPATVLIPPRLLARALRPCAPWRRHHADPPAAWRRDSTANRVPALRETRPQTSIGKCRDGAGHERCTS